MRNTRGLGDVLGACRGRFRSVPATAPLNLGLREVLGEHHRAGQDAVRPHPRIPAASSTASMRVMVGIVPLLMK